jgi:hypothetical protein
MVVRHAPQLRAMQHQFRVREADGSRKTITSTFCEYGSGNFSAMARTVRRSRATCNM